jgi:5-methylcytosine-specific restriction endonuclease McrA
LQDKRRAVPATEVDHIVDIVDAPHLRLEHSNLQSLCKPCHSAKTRLKQNAQMRQR